MTDRTTLVVPVPEAEPLVGATRALLDPHARRGLGAHITLLSPWLGSVDFRQRDLQRLRTIIRQTEQFEAKLVTIGRFRHTLWLSVEPREPLVQLAELIRQEWPQVNPTSGVLCGPPHLTIADHVYPERLKDLAESIDTQLPLSFEVVRVDLMKRAERNGKWCTHSEIPLGKPMAAVGITS